MAPPQSDWWSSRDGESHHRIMRRKNPEIKTLFMKLSYIIRLYKCKKCDYSPSEPCPPADMEQTRDINGEFPCPRSIKYH